MHLLKLMITTPKNMKYSSDSKEVPKCVKGMTMIKKMRIAIDSYLLICALQNLAIIVKAINNAIPQN